MLDLFRFVVLRPPEKKDGANTILPDGSTPLITQLRDARESDSPSTEIKRVADAFIASDAFLSDPATLELAPQLDAFHAELQVLQEEEGTGVALQVLSSAVRNAFGVGASEVTNDAALVEAKRNLYDSILAAKFGSSALSVGRLQLCLRLIDLISRIARSDESLNEPGALKEALSRSIGLPPGWSPLPVPRESTSSERNTREIEAPRNELNQRHAQLTEAYQFLTTLAPGDFAGALSEPDPAENAGHRPPENISNEVLFRGIQDIQGMIATERAAGAARFDAMNLVYARGGSKANLTARAVERLAPETRSTLSGMGVNLATVPLSFAVERTSAELRALAPKISQELVSGKSNVALVGSQFYPQESIKRFGWYGEIEGLSSPSWPLIPQSHGSVKPVGVGDLLVVKQQLVGYEPGEIAYIENILKGESHKRAVNRSETVEESVTTEHESIKEEERDLQTTERFEMRRESENVVNLDGRLKGNGNFISPGYGGVVEFENNNDAELQGAQQISERTASTYGKEVTSRATNKITERVRTQVVRRTVRQFEEKTEHSFENKEGDGHVVGIYQWIDKIYEAQVYNYGKRLFYDIVVPEPGAFLIQALARHEAEGRELIKPEPFTYDVDQITDLNYASLAQKYGAVGIEPPPPLYRNVSKSWAESDPASQIIAKKDDIPFPGYKVIGYSWIARTAKLLSQTNPDTLQILLGTSEATKNENLHGEMESISVNLLGINVSHIVAGIEVFLERTESTYRTWKGRAHAAISQAYQKKNAEYQERLANLQAALRVGVVGLSAERKREMERVELKKHCIHVITAQDFSIFNAIGYSAQPDPISGQPVYYSQPSLAAAEAQGKYIRFFEQAFEWEQMIYQFYPYFWARKNHWMTKGLLEDNDKQFQEFLKAGAARVLVPVRPGFEPALFHFMETGEIWEGADPPEMSSSLYVPLIDEIKATDKAAGEETPYGEPWKFRLPTSLVKLRKDAELPTWSRSPGGEWVADE